MSDTNLRNVPVQARSNARLTEIETAALRVLARVGRDRLTTGMVAAEAECSIGTVYRYFTDRVAILDAIWPDRDAHLPKRVLQVAADQGITIADATAALREPLRAAS